MFALCRKSDGEIFAQGMREILPKKTTVIGASGQCITIIAHEHARDAERLKKERQIKSPTYTVPAFFILENTRGQLRFITPDPDQVNHNDQYLVAVAYMQNNYLRQEVIEGSYNTKDQIMDFLNANVFKITQEARKFSQKQEAAR